MKIIYIIILFLFIKLSIKGQSGNTHRAFNIGEKISYNVYYNLGFMWFNAAEVFFDIDSTYYKNKKSYHFKSYGYTLPNYSWIYKVNDSYESIVDYYTFKPMYFYRDANEGSSRVKSEYRITDSLIYTDIYNSNLTNYKNKDTVSYEDSTFDILTTVYVYRNINYEILKPNDIYPIKVLVDGKIYKLHLHYLGIEDAEDDQDKIYRCRKFKVLVVKGSIFDGNEDVVVWISDDKSRVPIRIEAKIIIGSVVVKMKNIEGNKWLLESKRYN